MRPPTTSPDLNAVAALVSTHEAVAIAVALFDRLDEDGRQSDADIVSSLLQESGICPSPSTLQGPRQALAPGRSRADGYSQGRSFVVMEAEFEVPISDDHGASTLSAALLARLRTDGQVELAAKVGDALGVIPSVSGPESGQPSPGDREQLQIQGVHSSALLEAAQQDLQAEGNFSIAVQPRLVELPKPPWANPEMRALCKLLVMAYDSVAAAKHLAETAGISLNHWNSQQALEPAWIDLLKVTMSQGMLQKLLERVLDDRHVSAYHPQLRPFRSLRLLLPRSGQPVTSPDNDTTCTEIVTDIAQHSMLLDGSSLSSLESRANSSLPSTATSRAPFIVPFPDNEDVLIGRDMELATLHRTLQGKRISGLEGMGGVGKTQLAVRYCYACRESYPGGIYWFDAASEDWLPQMANLARRLGFGTAESAPTTDLALARRFADHVRSNQRTLLIADNVRDPASLRDSLRTGFDASLLSLGAHVLYTSRRKRVDQDIVGMSLTVLTAPCAKTVLVRGYPRVLAITESAAADSICRRLGNLPLALVLAAAYLRENTFDVSFSAYDERLSQAGALDVDNVDIDDSALASLHELRVRATLTLQWEAVSDKTARHLLTVAAVLPESEIIPVARLSIFSGTPAVPFAPGRVSPVRAALKHLLRWSLIEFLSDHAVRLHPLVRAFAQEQVPYPEAFRLRTAQCAADTLTNMSLLNGEIALRGVDEALADTILARSLFLASMKPGDLNNAAVLSRHASRPTSPYLRGVQLLSAEVKGVLAGAPPSKSGVPDLVDLLAAVTRCVGAEAGHLRRWDVQQFPAYCLQHLVDRFRAAGEYGLQENAEVALSHLGCSYLRHVRGAVRDSAALLYRLPRHSGRVTAIAITPNGRFGVSASHDSSLIVWELPRCAFVQTLLAHGGPVLDVAITHDARLAVSAGEDTTLIVWNIETGSAIHTLKGHHGAVNSVATHPSSLRAISGSEDGTLTLWDLDSGTLCCRFVGHQSAVTDVAFTPDGSAALSVDKLGCVLIWDATMRLGGVDTRFERAAGSGRKSMILESRNSRVLVSASSSPFIVVGPPDGRRFFSASSREGVVAVHQASRPLADFLDNERGKKCSLDTRFMQPHSGPVAALACWDDGRVASCSSDGTVVVWGEDGLRSHVLQGHSSGASAVAAHPGGRLVLSGSCDGTLIVWDLDRDDQSTTQERHPGPVTSVRISPDERFLISASYDSTVLVWGTAWGTKVGAVQAADSPKLSIEIGPDGRVLFVASSDGKATWTDIATGRIVRQEFLPKTDGPFRVALAPDGEALAFSMESAIVVREVRTGRTMYKFGDADGQRVEVLRFSELGRYLASVSMAGTIDMWEMDRGHKLYAGNREGGRVLDVALNDSRDMLISAHDDGRVGVWELASGRHLRWLEGHNDRVEAVAVDASGGAVVSVSSDRTVRLWDSATGACKSMLFVGSRLLCCDIARRGEQIAVGDALGEVHLIVRVQSAP